MAQRKTTKPNRKGLKRSLSRGSVFLNIPYDDAFENLLLAYISGLSAFGFVPRATLEIPFSTRKLKRIDSLIQYSEYSIHEMSRVQLHHDAPPTPRSATP